MGYSDDRTMSVLALVKGGERYIFIYDDGEKSRDSLFQLLAAHLKNLKMM